MSANKQGITLAELIIAVSLLGVIILAATTFDTTIRQGFQHSDIQVQLLTELSPAMQHMTKHIMQGIGSVSRSGVIIGTLNRRMGLRLDINSGTRNPNNTPADCSDDTWVTYGFSLSTHRIIYSPVLSTGCILIWILGWPDTPLGNEEVIARRIIDAPPIFDLVDSDGDGTDDVVLINITACQDPDENPIDCGDPGNPQVNLRTHVSLRAASVR